MTSRRRRPLRDGLSLRAGDVPALCVAWAKGRRPLRDGLSLRAQRLASHRRRTRVAVLYGTAFH